MNLNVYFHCKWNLLRSSYKKYSFVRIPKHLLFQQSDVERRTLEIFLTIFLYRLNVQFEGLNVPAAQTAVTTMRPHGVVVNPPGTQLLPIGRDDPPGYARACAGESPELSR